MIADIIAEGQSEPEILRQLLPSTSGVVALQTLPTLSGQGQRRIVADADPEFLIDAVFGAIYYRLLFRSAPLTEEFGVELVRQVFRSAKARIDQSANQSGWFDS